MSKIYKPARALYDTWFCGNDASQYAKENGYLDYATFSKAFDAVQIDAESLFRAEEMLGGYPEPVGTRPDYSDEIDELREQADKIDEDADDSDLDADDLEEQADDADEDGNGADADELRKQAEKKRARADELRAEAEKLRDKADELEEEQDEEPEIFQYFIVSPNGAEMIQDYTDDPLFYLEKLDMYIWGVTHWGTSWDYVLTDIRLNAGEEIFK